MKTVRINVFETNSSSTHSLAVSVKPWEPRLYLSED